MVDDALVMGKDARAAEHDALVAGSADPYYTQVKAGAYNEVRPAGAPCDAAIQDGCPQGRKLPMAGKIAMGVVISVVGLVIVAVAAYWVHVARSTSPASVKA